MHRLAKTGMKPVMLTEEQLKLCQNGVKLLQKPILPLARLAGMLYITGPFETISSLLPELSEPIETHGITYQNPGELLREYQKDLLPFERLKHPQPGSRIFLDENYEGLESFEAVDSWVSQNVLTRELETINSLLCGPCNCNLCCIGPDKKHMQDFFEIPLLPDEIDLFQAERYDTPLSRTATPNDEEPLQLNGEPFFSLGIALINWQTGWSLILPRNKHCPHLDMIQGGCQIYIKRPDVCRRPQIFPYMIEREPACDQNIDGKNLPAFIVTKKLLAIWDCPYVREFQDEIGRYAEICEIEPIFKENKG